MLHLGSQWGPYGLPNPSTEFDWGGWGPNMGLLSFRGRVYVLQFLIAFTLLIIV